MDVQHIKGRFGAGIGAGLMFGKTLIIVTGLQLISYASRIDDAARRCQIKVLGMALAMALGPLAELAAYAFAPQSLLAPINGFDLVWNVILAPFTLGETHNRTKIVGTCIVFVGSCIAPIFGPHKVSAVSLDDMRQTFLSFRFLVYSVVCLLGFLFGVRILKRRKQLRQLRRLHSGNDAVRGMWIGAGGGFLAGQTYFLSASATLLHASINEGNWSAWLDWLPYTTVGGAIACAILNAILMNKGLAEFEAMFFVPMFAGSAISAACISAVVVLRETASLPYWRMACYWSGILLVVIGLSFLVEDTRRRGSITLELALVRNPP